MERQGYPHECLVCEVRQGPYGEKPGYESAIEGWNNRRAGRVKALRDEARIIYCSMVLTDPDMSQRQQRAIIKFFRRYLGINRRAGRVKRT
jgi:hypothetical protein